MSARGEPSGRRLGYVIAIAINLFALWVVHNVANWDLSFITASWPQVLWAFNLSLGATMVANALFLVYDAPWFRHLAQMVLNLLGIVVIVTLFRVFPFDFGPQWVNQLARLALVLALLGTGIAVIVEFVSLVRAVTSSPRP